MTRMPRSTVRIETGLGDGSLFPTQSGPLDGTWELRGVWASRATRPQPPDVGSLAVLPFLAVSWSGGKLKRSDLLDSHHGCDWELRTPPAGRCGQQPRRPQSRERGGLARDERRKNDGGASHGTNTSERAFWATNSSEQAG